ncbi:MAG: GHKL domain-containing protein [Clostridium sp.]|nr:GHKL domain-containing protein [Clostridium sp.]
MIEILFNIFLAVLSAYIVFEYYKTFFEEKSKRMQVVVIILIYMGWQIISMPSVSNIPAIVRLLLSVLFVAFVGCGFEGSFIGKNVFAIIYNAMWMLCELLVSVFFLNNKIVFEEYDLLGSFLCECILLILVKLLAIFFRHDSVRDFSWKYNGILMMIPLGCMVFSYHLFMLSAKSEEKSDLWISVIVFVILLVVVSFIFLMYIKLIDAYELKRKNDIFKLELDLYLEHMKEKESTMLEIRKTKHDLKHKLTYMLELSKNKEYEKLETYIAEVADLKSWDELSVANTGHSFIDVLINSKYVTAQKYGIKFRMELDIPYNLPFDNADLCVILGNALDNAIEANQKQGIEDAYIDLKMKYDRGNLAIFLENTFDGIIRKDSEGRLITRKKDKENHGYLDIDIKDKIYKLTIIMYLPQTVQ